MPIWVFIVRYEGEVFCSTHFTEKGAYLNAIYDVLEYLGVEEEEYARDDTTRVRNRTTYDDQKWMRIPTAMIRQLDGLWAIGEEVLVRFDASEFELHIQPLAARAAARRAAQ